MALMLAGKVISITQGKAIVNVEGKLIEAKLDFIKDVKPGDYVTIYYGIVLEKVSKREAEESMERCSYNHSSKVDLSFLILK